MVCNVVAAEVASAPSAKTGLPSGTRASDRFVGRLLSDRVDGRVGGLQSPANEEAENHADN